MPQEKPLVRFHSLGQVPNHRYRFAVIAAQVDGRWLLVRHRKRNTWEIPGGHREEGEDIDQTAERELLEETGATRFSLTPVSDYSVTAGDQETFGRLYYAEVDETEPLRDSEIGETRLFDDLPGNLTYPDIQPHLARQVTQFIESRRTP